MTVNYLKQSPLDEQMRSRSGRTLFTRMMPCSPENGRSVIFQLLFESALQVRELGEVSL
jgi:hypothetical protein